MSTSQHVEGTSCTQIEPQRPASTAETRTCESTTDNNEYILERDNLRRFHESVLVCRLARPTIAIASAAAALHVFVAAA
jgi:hypothetical protein